MTKQIAQTLLDLGADFTGGIAYLNRKEVGRWANGEFYVEPGMESTIEVAKDRKQREQAVVRENAELLAKSKEPAAKKAEPATVAVPEKPESISAEEAATKQNSIPGSGPQNPVRADGYNNRQPDTDPVDMATLLDNLQNPNGAAAVKEGEKATKTPKK